MSLDKGIAHGKELRKPYYKSKRFDRTCRPGGTCDYCKGNRMHSTKKRELSARDQIHEAVHGVIHEAGWLGNTPADQGIMAAREDDRRRTMTIRQDLKVLGGLIEQISDWSNDVDYLTTAEQVKIGRLCMELGHTTGEIARRLKV